MQPIERTIRIAAPLNFCWSVFTDIDRLPERLDHVLSVTRIDGPPFGVGTRWRHATRPPAAMAQQRDGAGLGHGVGQSAHAPTGQVAAVVEVIGCEPGQYYALAIETAIGRSVYAYEFTEIAPNMTELRAIAQMQPTGLRSRFTIWALRKVIVGAVEKAFDHLLGEMKRVVERLHLQQDQ